MPGESNADMLFIKLQNAENSWLNNFTKIIKIYKIDLSQQLKKQYNNTTIIQ